MTTPSIVVSVYAYACDVNRVSNERFWRYAVGNVCLCRYVYGFIAVFQDEKYEPVIYFVRQNIRNYPSYGSERSIKRSIEKLINGC